MFNLFSLLLLAFALPAFASPTAKDTFLRRAPHVGETNAERFARGLTPLKPRKLFNTEVSRVETGLRPRQSASEAPFTCVISFSQYGNPVCCDPSELSVDQINSNGGDIAYEAPDGACYFNYVTIGTVTSTGCIAATDVPLCCSGAGANNELQTEQGPGPYTDTFYALAVHGCFAPTFN